MRAFMAGGALPLLLGVYLLNTNSFWTPLLSFLETREASSCPQAEHSVEKVQVVDDADGLVSKLQRTDALARWDFFQTSFLQLEVRTEITKAASVATGVFGVGVLPAIVASIIAATTLGVFGVHSSSVSSNQRVADLFMLITVLAATSRMISVPDSHALATALGQGASWSGLYLGISKWGDMVGNLICAFPLHRWPDFWQTGSRKAMMYGLAIMSAGSALCLLALSRVSIDSDTSKLAIMLCVSRAIIGIGNGIVTQLVIVLLAKLTPPDELPGEFQRAVFYVTVGTGLGPLAAAAGYSIDFGHATEPQFKLVGLIQLILLSSGFCAVTLFFPSKISSEEVKTAKAEKESPPCNEVLILSGLVLCMLRSFVAGSVEVSTPLLLEQTYGWSIASTGLITGAAFLMGLPIRLAHVAFGKKLSQIAWIRLLTVAAALGTVLLFRVASMWLPGGASLVLGDMIIFPSIYLGEGLTQGVMMQFVPHEGSYIFFHAVSIALVMDMLINAFLGLGAVSARSIIQAGGEFGQDFNAATQLLVCIAFLVIFEVGMARYILDCRD